MITIELIETTNYIVSVFALITLIATAFIVYDLYSKQLLKKLVSSYGLFVALVTTFVASAITLLYSEVYGVIPCGLCWLERIMLYPQVFMLATAIFFKDVYVARYGITLSALGLIISLYHHYIQMGGSQLVGCPAVGDGADCTKRFLFEFGFVTYPLLASILFAFLIVLYVYLLRVKSSSFRLED